MEDVILNSGILDQIQSLVIDASQVVSYKWLSRNFSVSSSAAKRILEEFVKVNEGNKVEVVYAVCGWSRSEPRTYNVQLVPKVKLQETKEGFDEPASQHVYSVQPCLPKDPAQLFSAEYVQAQEFFMQPRDVDNCLRDNRGWGSKSVIDQLKAEPSASAIPPSLKRVAGSITPKADPQAQLATPPVSAVPAETAVKSTEGAVVKDESARKNSSGAVLGKTVPENIAVGKKKTGATGGSSALANLWGKAPAKSKVATAAAVPTLITGDAEAAIRATEGSEPSSDEEASDFARIRRCQAKSGNGRKRQVVLDEDLSEDEEGMNSQIAINLASPEPFKRKSQVKAEAESDAGVKIDLPGPSKMDIDDEIKIPSIPQCDHGDSGPEEVSKRDEFSVGVKREAESGCGAGGSVKPPPEPKRKKVMKTRINERGKEVTEVVWETDGVEEIPEGKPVIVPQKCPAPPVASKVPSDRPPAPAKAPQKGISTKAPGKAVGKAATSKGQGSGQGSLLSFFKKKT